MAVTNLRFIVDDGVTDAASDGATGWAIARSLLAMRRSRWTAEGVRRATRPRRRRRGG